MRSVLQQAGSPAQLHVTKGPYSRKNRPGKQPFSGQSDLFVAPGDEHGLASSSPSKRSFHDATLFGDPRINTLLHTAQNSTAAVNGLLCPEHIAYCLWWRNQVNPQSRKLSALYAAMGPDLATVLHTTDANHITGVEIKNISAEKILSCLQYWNLITIGKTTIPTTIPLTLSEHAKDYVKCGLISPEQFYEDFEDTITARRDRGYWDIAALKFASWEFCLVYELKQLGVARDSIHISQKGEVTVIDFTWAFPGHPPRRRRLEYIEADITNFVKRQRQRHYNVFYQKSRQTDEQPNPSFISMLSNLLKPDSWILMGYPLGDQATNHENRRNDLTSVLLGLNFTFVPDGKEVYQTTLKKFTSEGDASPYGWRLHGMRRQP